ncbi:MAG: DUF2147 domain-containing protein [Bradyrhizobium sp.]
MRKLLAIAVLLLASTAAQAQYSFEYGGRTIRVDPDRGTVSIPGVYDNTGKKAKRSGKEDADRSRKQTPQQAKTDPQAAPDAAAAPVAAPAPSEQAAAPAAVPVPAAPAPAAEPSTTTAAVTPADTAVTPPPPPAPPVQQDPVPAPAAAKPAPAPAVAAAPPAAAAPAPAPSAVVAANSPLGLWLTEEKEGKVRIEQCGANLCGYSVDKKSNQNGEQVLINMKPGKDSKWSGRILDPNTGSTYDSTIALKGSDSLRVQGCAFGGVFCGGQNWTRVN